jgi:acyl-coenzyme A synthetase/AMP-(fatty) acid ligase
MSASPRYSVSAFYMTWLIDRLHDFGARPALVLPDESCDYAKLAKLVAECIAKMNTAGVRAGDVVAIPGDHSPGTVAGLLACLALNCVAVPIGAVTPSEAADRRRIARVAWSCDGAGPARVALSGEEPALLAGLRERGRPGLVLFSSGTSGEPKAICHDLGVLADAYRDRKPKALALVLFLLFDHIGGLNTLFGGLASGATLVVPADRSPERVCEMIARHRVAVLPTSPTFLNLLLLSGCRERHDLSSLRIISYGTEPMPESLLHRLRESFHGVKFIQTFGTSETGIAHTVSQSSDSTWLRFDDPDQESKIVDGELWLRSKTRALGYLNHDSSRFSEDGWFRTGDRVEVSGEGFLRITGRLSEVINVGGEKVMPAEVESVILEVPGVLDALVGGEPSPITGSMVVARVVPAVSGGSDDLKRAIRSHCREKLAGYKAPARITFVDALEVGSRLKKIRRA